MWTHTPPGEGCFLAVSLPPSPTPKFISFVTAQGIARGMESRRQTACQLGLLQNFVLQKDESQEEQEGDGSEGQGAGSR